MTDVTEEIYLNIAHIHTPNELRRRHHLLFNLQPDRRCGCRVVLVMGINLPRDERESLFIHLPKSRQQVALYYTIPSLSCAS